MKGCKTCRHIGIICVLLCFLLFLIAFVLGAVRYNDKVREATEGQVVAYLINKRFVLNNPYSKEELLEFGNPNDMVNALGDEYSSFMTKKEVDASVARLDNIYTGLGFEATKKEGEVLEIQSVHPSTPSLYAGLARGDKIIKIDGNDTAFMSLGETIGLIRGEKGSFVSLGIQRGDKYFTKKIKRETIKGHLVESRMLDNQIGYLSISGFPLDLYKEVIGHLVSLKSNGMKKLIIDLRGNEGGEVKEVAPILSMILPFSKKVLYSVKYKDSDSDRFRRSNEIVFLGPIAVLCDNRTASAAELFISVLKDLNRATIIGDVTYGKQTTQRFYHFKSGNVLKLSTGIMLSPKQTYYEGIGIMPDIHIVMNPLLSRAGFINEKDESYNVRLNAVRKVLTEEYGSITASKMIENGDVQLKKAFEYLSTVSPTIK